MKIIVRLLYLIVPTFLGCTNGQSTAEEVLNSPLPNIVIIYADDMGYGDLNIQNPDSKIPTPNLDQLANEGMRFTDAHSSSGICSPSRYALLTGNYHWRRKHDFVRAFEPPFFSDEDITLPQLLKTKGYTTACIGKWHLGWDWTFQHESENGKRKYPLAEEIDWSEPITGGPIDRGFDYYFGDGTINFPPYAWIENDRFVEAPTEMMPSNDPGFETKEGNWEFRPGPKVKDWNPYEVLPAITQRTVSWIGEQKQDAPFFLYFALPSPHAPIIPNEEFDGKSQAGAYGDFMFQTDWVVGQVLNALQEKELEENTLVIFSSDNGPEYYAWERAETYGHFSMADFRGVKRDVWEGGHHVPLLIKWPGKIKPGVSDEVISQVDLTATIADAIGLELPDGAALDSYNFLPLLKGKQKDSPIREATIHNTFKSIWGIRQGDWLYINDSTGAHMKIPKSFQELKGGYESYTTEGLLFNMREDPGQRVNLYAEHPEKVAALDELLMKYREQGYSVSRKPIKN